MNRNARFWDKRADKYSQTPVRDDATYQKKLEITRSYLGPDMRVLEIGCGTGSTAIALAPCVRHILATDVSPRMIEIARGKAEAAQIRNVMFEARDIGELESPGGEYDVIMAHNVLHLVEDMEAAIADSYRMLKAGGVFVTSTAVIGDMTKVFRIILPVGRFLGLIPFVGVFNRAELKQSLTGAGFEIDHDWLPKKNAAVFIVARKPA